MAGTGVAVRTLLDTGGTDGAAGLVRRLVRMPAGARFDSIAGPGGELGFVLAGSAMLEAGGGPSWPVRADAAMWLPPGARYALVAGDDGEVRLDSVSLPAAAGSDADSDGVDAAAVAALGDCPEEVTGDRRFRVLFGPGRGCWAATQFAGEIPPGRAPDHVHPYDEVVLILAGHGVLHTGDGDRPLAPGSCVHLPPGLPHCLENTGQDTLRVLGVFHPGGSPAAKEPADR
jgi:quercetin dioxygenase-like cupin family protein